MKSTKEIEIVKNGVAKRWALLRSVVPEANVVDAELVVPVVDAAVVVVVEGVGTQP